jgi:transcriptional regulator with XRE-family HTH domain
VSIWTQVKGYFVSIGNRLKEERNRLGISQDGFAQTAGIQRRAQVRYEQDERVPDGTYFAAIAEAGVDVQYVITGKRQGQGIGESAVHRAVLDAVDLLSLEKKVDADQLARAVVKLVSKASPFAATPRNEQVFHGQVGQAIKIEGELNQSGISFFSENKRKK